MKNIGKYWKLAAPILGAAVTTVVALGYGNTPWGVVVVAWATVLGVYIAPKNKP